MEQNDRNRLQEYRESSLLSRRDMFERYLRYNLKMSESTINQYVNYHEKNDSFRRVVKRISGVESLYDVMSVKELDAIYNEVNGLPDNKKRNNIYSAAVKKYKEYLEYLYSTASVHSFSPESEPFSVSAVIDAVKSTGLLYDDLLIKRFAYSLLSKRFLILSGLAGSGKTQLALAFSKAMIESEKQLCVVSVGADWTNREPLLGYPNALKSGSYVKPESGVLDLLIEANSDPERPYFLILDEMNLSVVERYFADFLSAMESHQPIALWKSEDDAPEVPETVSLPDNLFIIGTINVDETTYMFSPKVLDRAHVLEFKISSDEMEKFLSEMRPVNVAEVLAACAGMGKEFVKAANSSPAVRTEINVILLEFFKQLKRVNAEFGYRSVMEINSFISKGLECEQENSESSLNLDCLTDCAIVQKLLPKLHGSRKKLSEVLESLWLLCFNQDSAGKEAVPEIETCDLSDVQNVRYMLSADKIQRMYITAVRNGFTSFAEA